MDFTLSHGVLTCQNFDEKTAGSVKKPGAGFQVYPVSCAGYFPGFEERLESMEEFSSPLFLTLSVRLVQALLFQL